MYTLCVVFLDRSCPNVETNLERSVPDSSKSLHRQSNAIALIPTILYRKCTKVENSVGPITQLEAICQVFRVHSQPDTHKHKQKLISCRQLALSASCLASCLASLTIELVELYLV